MARVAAALLAGLLVVATGCVEAEPKSWAYELQNTLMSPYCPGRALSECPSPQAEQLRAWIVHREQEGATRAEVEEQLFARFGDTLRQAPRAEGVGLVAYVIPVVLTLLGGVLVAVFFRHVRARREDEADDLPPAPALDPELVREVDAELAAVERRD
jgi:cytochrome c-type biogenesis protein CcmH/NrfF